MPWFAGRWGRRGVIAGGQPELLEQLVGGLQEGGALAQEPVASAGHRVVDAARNGEDVATLIGGPARGDQGTRCEGRLDHHDELRQAGDEPVAEGKVVSPWCHVGGELAQDDALAKDAEMMETPGAAEFLS